jgi:hypothetical protein
MDISWGPCCFCGEGIDPHKPDPCRINRGNGGGRQVANVVLPWGLR